MPLSLQRLYQKDYHQSKTKTHIPPDIIPNQVAKRCQDMLSDVIYRTYLHQWTCHPDQEDAIRARKTNEILSDVSQKCTPAAWSFLFCILLCAIDWIDIQGEYPGNILIHMMMEMVIRKSNCCVLY